LKTKFNKVKLDKSGQAVVFGITQTSPLGSSDVLTSKAPALTMDKPPHKDLSDAFVDLIPHLLFSSELFPIMTTNKDWYESREFLEEKIFTGITVHELQILNQEETKIKLIGSKTTTLGEVVPLQSVIIDMEADGPDKYLLITVLSEVVERVISEAGLYYSNQKYGSFVEQQALDLV